MPGRRAASIKFLEFEHNGGHPCERHLPATSKISRTMTNDATRRWSLLLHFSIDNLARPTHYPDTVGPDDSHGSAGATIVATVDGHAVVARDSNYSHYCCSS